uniref:Kunitz domain-containing protein isoform 2 n=1 Tax=Cupiennius salei TaxID=6928 RepID=A0A4Y5UHL2_CUPSA|nr:kunitz domain-containing protein isoform 2 [Cupiennius salei]
MLMVFLLASSIGVALSSPFVRPNYNNIPQCLQPMESGLCLAYIPSFYYNAAKGTCDNFVYGGCQGNSNRFFSFDECMAKCGNFKPETNENFKLVLENGEDQDSSEDSGQQVDAICSLPSVMGPCRAMMPRFYFNGDKCQSFIFGGCEGNGNNFRSVEECEQRCGSNSTEEVGENSDEASEKVSKEESSEEGSDENSEESKN